MRKVLVIGTGGTISCAETPNGLAPTLSVDDLLRKIELPADTRSEQLFNLDGTNMTPRHWEQLARDIRTRYDEFDGFVITHGTDTMAYAAASLSCLFQNSRKPIVFTGSMKPMTAENSDAPKNLRNAVALAADERSFGVRLAFGDRIFDGRKVSKINSREFNAFDSINYDEKACFNENGEIIFDEEYSGETRFYDRLSDDVFLVKLIPAQPLVVPKGKCAVIIESYGAGGVPEYLSDDIIKLSKSGIYVIITTSCPYGGTNLCEYEVGKSAANACTLFESGKATVEYTVAKARWALAYSDNSEDFKKLFCVGNAEGLL